MAGFRVGFWRRGWKWRCGLEQGRGIKGDLTAFEELEGGEGLDKGGAGAGFEGELPGVAAAGAFVEGGEGRREGESGVLLEGLVEGLDVFDGGGFGFEGEAVLISCMLN